MSAANGSVVPIEGNMNTLGMPDPSYRYKMHLLTARPTSHNLVISNMREVAKDLCMDPKWIAKYFQIECGCRCKYNAKDGTALLSMGHSSSRDSANLTKRVQHLLRDFIDKYVICPATGCMNAEFSLQAGSKFLESVCPACGARELVPDTSHKVSTTIAKDLKAKAKADKKKARRRGAHRASSSSGDEVEVKGTRGRSKKDKKSKKSKKRKGRGRKACEDAAPMAASLHGVGGDNNADDPEFAAMVAGLASVAVAADGDDDFLWSSDDDGGSAAAPGGSKFF